MGGRGSSMANAHSNKTSKKAADKNSASYKPLSNSELKNMSEEDLKEHLGQLTKEYYKSGISFGGRDINSVVNALMKQKRSYASMMKEYKVIKKRMGYK